jgi:hypothetical protein
MLGGGNCGRCPGKVNAAARRALALADRIQIVLAHPGQEDIENIGKYHENQRLT